MGLKINETVNGEIYGSEQYVSSRKGSEGASAGKAPEQAVTYEHGEEQSAAYGVYTKAQIMSTAASTENKQFQNRLKTMGFYNTSVATDGDLSSAESKRAIANFQRVYGLTVNGIANDSTKGRLSQVVAVYQSTLSDPDLAAVAQIVKGRSDYNEAVVKGDVARVWTFLRVGMNLTAKQASGVMGNIMRESGASPTNANDDKMGNHKLRDTNYIYSDLDGIAYGIIQWLSADRKKGLADMAGKMNSKVSDCNVQFAFLRSELESEYYNPLWKKVTSATDVETAAKAFCIGIEGASWEENLTKNKRMEYANTVYDALA